MSKKVLTAATAAGLLLVGACSSSSTTETGSGDNGSGGGSGGTTAGTVAETDGTMKAKECETSLEVVNASAEESVDISNGELDIETAWADKGPHPDNTVDYDSTLDLAFATYEIPVDEQFGYSIPIGVPDEAPDDGVYFSIALEDVGGTIGPDMTFIDQTDPDVDAYDGEINFYAVYYGSERLLPGDITVTITDMTDDYVCGEISSETKTDLQSFIGIEGTFKADRIQYLEAMADES